MCAIERAARGGPSDNAGLRQPMSNPNAPVKTPLGHQELRQRTQGLGQRYRTVLLLVDGRRTVAEVLTMAQQAGAQTAHFEELVRLGMVELPAPPPPPPPEPPAEAPAAQDGAQTAAVELEPGPGPAIEPDVPVAPAPPVEFEPATPAAVVAPAAPPAASPAEPPAAPPVARAEPVVAPEAAASAERKLDDARRLLIDILRRDTLLQRVFAPARVRGAQTQEELIGLVWEIERERAHARRKRVQLINLQRARELLGMGNTVVAEDSLPTPPED